MDTISTSPLQNAQLTQVDSAPQTDDSGSIERGDSNTPSSRTKELLESKRWKINDDGKAELQDKSKLAHWGVKLAAGLAIGAGIALFATGVGAVAGLGLVAMGLGASTLLSSAIYSGFDKMETAAANKILAAEADKESPTDAALKDVGKGLAKAAIPLAVAAPIVAAVVADDAGGGSPNSSTIDMTPQQQAYPDLSSNPYGGSQRDASQAAHQETVVVVPQNYQNYYDAGQQIIYGIVQTDTSQNTPVMPQNQYGYNPYV